MAAFNSVDDLYRSLIDSSQNEKNEEMEESMLETLFRDQKYDLILYALEKGFILTPGRIKQIKISGDLKLCQYLFKNQKLEFDFELMNLTIKSGNLETIKWLGSNGCPWNKWSHACACAAENGHLEVLKWLRENGCPWDELVPSDATQNGHFEILKWSRENGCPWDQWTCAFAALRGDLEVLKWLRENECPWDESTCSYAARGGHLEILQWVRSEASNLGSAEARANRCPWDANVCANAACGGHLEVLKWLRENGCPWNKYECFLYAKDYPEIQEWIKAN